MREHERAPEWVAPAIDEVLLDAKISVPQPRPGLVGRVDLIETARERAIAGWSASPRLRVRQVDVAGPVGAR